MESRKEDMFENIFIECPYCACVFTSQVDLDSHLEAFGTNTYEHNRKLDAEHKKTNRTYVKGSLRKDSKSRSSSTRRSGFYKY